MIPLYFFIVLSEGKKYFRMYSSSQMCSFLFSILKLEIYEQSLSTTEGTKNSA